MIISTYRSGSKGLLTIINETYWLGADGWLFFSEIPLENKGSVLEQLYPVVFVGEFLSYGKANQMMMLKYQGGRRCRNRDRTPAEPRIRSMRIFMRTG